MLKATFDAEYVHTSLFLKTMRRTFSLLAVLLLLLGCAVPAEVPGAPSIPAANPIGVACDDSQSSKWVAPLSLDRVTKKPFGIYVEPGNSPVSPERFRGFHTGMDFETLPDETDIFVLTACCGPVILNQWVSGYGGVVVQQCTLDGELVTVLYGHLCLSSVSTPVGDTLTAGASFALLGTGGSHETDGERRHLHLAIHRGSGVELKGYVQRQEDLSSWIDPMTVLR